MKKNEIFFTKTKLIINLTHDIVTQYKINELKKYLYTYEESHRHRYML